MADVHGSPRVSDTAGASASTRQESTRPEERRERMQETGREVVHRAQELAEEGKQVATEYYEQGRERVLAWQQQLEKQVRERPIQTLLMAAGVGLLVGLLKRR